VLRIGLTGGIASGKSTVAAMFAELGAEILDTDDIAHALVAAGGAAIAAITASFGEAVITAEGALDRPRMRRKVFADAEQRLKLEAILHPLIRETAGQRAAASSAPYVMLVAPLLFETGFDRLVTRTVTVDCPESIQIQRVVERDAVTEDEARAVIAAQMNRQDRLDAADDVIDTGGPLAATRQRVTELHEQYLRFSENCPGAQGRAE
jgi:dephospho-CoA kinase